MDNHLALVARAIVPDVAVGDIAANEQQIAAAIHAAEPDVDVLLFPELAVTGYTCFDLFQSADFIATALAAVQRLAAMVPAGLTVIVGTPLISDGLLYNVAAVLNDGRIIAFVPKTFIPNTHEYYEKRWFDSALGLKSRSWTDPLTGQQIPLASELLFEHQPSGVSFAIELCEDLWAPVPPSTWHCLAGASVIFNLSASNELIAKAAYRRDLVRMQSARCACAYLYVSAGYGESTTDTLFSGAAIAANYGSLLAAEQLGESGQLTVVLDAELPLNQRRSQTSWRDSVQAVPESHGPGYRRVAVNGTKHGVERWLAVDPRPFVPSDAQCRAERCREILEIQSQGLAQRLRKTGIRRVVLGISGGLDSTLALIVCTLAFDSLGRSPSDIITVTMPGFGTSQRTLDSAHSLMAAFGTNARSIDITAACRQHMADIGQDPGLHDITFENIQARERTQILMDIANREGALVVGTGDLSETALGWCTYNGDHMSMYAVNIGVPKSLVRYLVAAYAELQSQVPGVSEVLLGVLDTPISPELLPTRDGRIVQRTEEMIGRYDLHDFFLYHFVHHGFSFARIAEMAQIAFAGEIEAEEIKATLQIFIQRFFSQQFKRSCMPDGIKVGSVSLSPRTDWRLPSDINPQAFL
ncbi:MAG: NAD(+) synthase [Coriobacteriales bacterium]|jgi:NAD+ synthase (glutamine-hydrolysing)|nr:NAD(+) synthase [Coriobacteriales bacterium]